MKKYCVFVNDHQEEMNVIADTEKQIEIWIDSNFNCKWKEIKRIEGVTSFQRHENEAFFKYASDEKILPFTDIRKKY